MTDNSSSRIGAIQASSPRHDGAAETRSPAPLSVGPATLAEAPQVVDVISAAFRHDPTWSWAFPDPIARRRWWELCTRSALRYPWVLLTSGFEAVSVWIPPDGIELTVEEERRLPQLLTELVGPRAPEVAELLRRFGEAHPRDEPHYYLSLLATADAHRGRGLGVALLRENLARIDAERRPAYLESSNPRNNSRYESLGFTPVVSFQAPGEGPVVTGMWRPGC